MSDKIVVAEGEWSELSPEIDSPREESPPNVKLAATNLAPCNAISPSGYLCTRVTGHEGVHLSEAMFWAPRGSEASSVIAKIASAENEKTRKRQFKTYDEIIQAAMDSTLTEEELAEIENSTRENFNLAMGWSFKDASKKR